MQINYPITSLLKVKLTPKSESKLYNYNKILKCTNTKSKLLFLPFLIYYYVIVYIKILSMICVMYDGKDKNTDSQTNNPTKYISNTHTCDAK